MIELLMRHNQGCLTPTDAIGFEAIHKLGSGKIVTARLTQTRNLQHHRMWFALLQTVFEAQQLYPTLNHLHDAIKIAIGHCEERRTLDGKLYWHPNSISFASLDQIGFRQFFDRAVKLITETILPNTTSADLEQRVYEILGEPTPQDLTLSH